MVDLYSENFSKGKAVFWMASEKDHDFDTFGVMSFALKHQPVVCIEFTKVILPRNLTWNLKMR